MRIKKATPEMAEYLAAMGIPGILPIELDDDALAKEHEQSKQQHPEESAEYQWARAVARVAYQKYQSRSKEAFQHPYYAKLSRLIHAYGIAILIVLGILLIFAVKAHAQIDVIRLKDDGVLQGTFAAPFSIDCTTNVTCTKSGSTWTISASGGAGTGCVPAGSAGNILTDDGAGGCTTELTKIPVTKGGTDKTSISAGTLLCGNGAVAPTEIAVGTLGQVLVSNGGTACPAMVDPAVQGVTAHDAVGTATNPVLIGGYASAAAPADVSADGDATRMWELRNGSQVVNLASGGTLVTLGQKVMASSLPIVIASDQGAIHIIADSGTITTVSTVTNLANLGGAAVSMNTGVRDGGTQRVTIATNDVVPASQSGTWNMRAQDGAGNALTSNSITTVAKFALDVNVLGTLGTAFTTAGKIDIKAADGDVFVRQATAANLNGTMVGTKTNNNAVPGATNFGVLPCLANAAQQSWTETDLVLNSCNLKGAQRNVIMDAALNDRGANVDANNNLGVVGVGTLADNGVAAATNRFGVLPCIYQTGYMNGTAATQGRNGSAECGSDGLLWTAQLPALRPASYHASASFAGSSTTFASHLIGHATNMVLVTKIAFSCTQTTAGVVTVTVNKTSAASTGGTALGGTEVPDDSSYSAASGAMETFTGTGPTVGTLVGQIDSYKLGCNATGTAGPNDIYILNLRQKPITLRATTQTLEIGVGAATTGGNYTVTWEWMELPIITP